MNPFDRVCAVLAGLLAVALGILGVLGLFLGCRANFTLPPVLGVIPALIGWGILRAVWLAWDLPDGRQPPERPRAGAAPPED